MGFFSSSKSHLETIEQQCATLTDAATAIRATCDRCLRGKYEYMSPEDQVGLLKDALGQSQKMNSSLAVAREAQRRMEGDQCPQADLLTAQALLLSAGLDAAKADQSLEEARSSLMAGMSEIEQFYGPQSREARHVRKILDAFGATA